MIRRRGRGEREEGRRKKEEARRRHKLVLCINYTTLQILVCLGGWLMDANPLAWLGLLWLGLVWLGLAWFGLAWFGLAWLGLFWFGLVWLGPWSQPWPMVPSKKWFHFRIRA